MSEITAVVCVIETSLTLAAEWPHVLANYLAPLLQRLGETQTSSSLRMGFVSYGTADTRPTPIVSRISFTTAQMMTQLMREKPQELGIGQTNVEGGQGMAALEGVVAAMEMFETLESSIEAANTTVTSDTIVTSHLIHIASAHPDTAERPMWNMCPSLHHVTWASIPAELRRRGIHYSNILLKRLTHFSELQASAAVGTAQTPWFNVLSPHTVLITGFPQKGTKRSTDTAPVSERSPDMKRTKVQPASQSPAVIEAAALPAPAWSTPAPVLADTGSGRSLRSRRLVIFQEQLRQAKMTLRARTTQIVELVTENHLKTAQQARLIIEQRAVKLHSALLSEEQQAQASSAGQPPVGPSVQPTPVPSAFAQTSDPPEPPAAAVEPEWTLIPLVNRHMATWQGTLSWSGFDEETHLQKDVHTSTLVVSLTMSSMRPSALILTLSQRPVAPPQVLTYWSVKYSISCLGEDIRPHPQAPDVEANEKHFRSLIRLLAKRNVYAFAAWAGPDGAVKTRLAIWQVEGCLRAVYFASPRGMPVLPNGEVPAPAPAFVPVPVAGVPTPAQNMPPVVASLTEHMAPEQQPDLHRSRTTGR